MEKEDDEKKVTLQELYETMYNQMADVLMTLEEWEKLKSVRESSTERLKIIYKISLEKENYEVCRVIKKVLEERGESTPE